MIRKIVRTDKAPAPVGPYSQAVWAGDMLFLSGQIAIDPSTNELVTAGVEAEARQCLENLKAVLASEGLGMANVVKVGIFLKDMNDFARVNEVYGGYFVEEPPARACVEVARLPKDVSVEIEAIACR